jgi:tRNA(Ile)-lysidine synthase
LLLAVSGGCDSVAMLELFHREEIGSRLSAIHVNHRLRPDAGEDQAFVEKLCRERNIPLEVEILDPATRLAGRSVEMWGRENRYQAFSRARKKLGADFTLTAHHRDDAVETFCLRLWRGTGFAGLAGIPFRRSDGVVRPLLMTGRAELKEWLLSLGTSWREDSSNADTGIPRNWVRRRLLPAWRCEEYDLDARIFRLTREVAGMQPAWEKWLGEFYPADEVRIRGGIPMDWLRDEAADAALLRRLLPLLGVAKPVPEVMAEILRQTRNSQRKVRVQVDETAILAEKNVILKCILNIKRT